MNRCDWCEKDPLYITYHDEEWAVPVHDDRSWFELLSLEGAQAGLNWLTILKKRENYRRSFANFDFEKVAAFDQADLEALLRNDGLIRHSGKIQSTIKNARAAIRLCEIFGSLDNYFWRFVDGKPILNHWTSIAEIPTETALSQKLSKDLKQNGFSFVGPRICYALMQAAGIVNDHLVSCFRHSR